MMDEDVLLEEMQKELYLHDFQWQENMGNMYSYDEGGFCDGFTNW